MSTPNAGTVLAGQTGPRTPEGKAVAARNAIAHGLTSNLPVIPGVERQDDWATHRQGIFESLAPQGHFEAELVARAAHLLWRLRRVSRYETATAIARTAADRAETEPADQAARVLPPPEVLDRVIRYEAHLARQLDATLDQFADQQDRRRGRATPTARLRVSGASGDAALGDRCDR